MRKSFVGFFLCLCLCMVMTLPAAAETSLSFGLGAGEVDAKSDIHVGKSEDFTGLFFGLDYTGEMFGAGFFWLEGNTDGNFGDNDDLHIRNLYGSWHMVKKDPFQLDLVLSYDWLKAGSGSASGPMLGLAGEVDLNERWILGAGFGYAISPSLEINNRDFDDASMWKASIDLSYRINERWSVGLGYNLYRISGRESLGGKNEYNKTSVEGSRRDIDFDIEADMAILSFTYRFGAAKPVEPEPAIVTPKEEPKIEEPKVETVVEPVKITEEPKLEETPAEKEERIERINEFLQPIFFNFDKYYLRKDQIPVLKKALEVINANKDLYLLIAGHADPPGTNGYNQKLSERRAMTVRNWLVENGIDPSRITMIGYGEEYPFMAQSDDPAWESDRWADVVMSDQEPTKEMGIRK